MSGVRRHRENMQTPRPRTRIQDHTLISFFSLPWSRNLSWAALLTQWSGVWQGSRTCSAHPRTHTHPHARTHTCPCAACTSATGCCMICDGMILQVLPAADHLYKKNCSSWKVFPSNNINMYVSSCHLFSVLFLFCLCNTFLLDSLLHNAIYLFFTYHDICPLLL